MPNRIFGVLTIEMEATIHADPGAVWKAWKPDFPKRPREEEARNLNLYHLAYGLKVPVTLIAVNELQSWTVEHALPRGKLVIDHWMVSLPDGRVRVGKKYDVYGPLAIVYRLFFARRIRASWPQAVHALEREATSRKASK